MEGEILPFFTAGAKSCNWPSITRLLQAKKNLWTTLTSVWRHVRCYRGKLIMNKEVSSAFNTASTN